MQVSGRPQIEVLLIKEITLVSGIDNDWKNENVGYMTRLRQWIV